MKRRWLVNAALLVAVLVAGWAVLREPAPGGPPKYRLAALDPEQVARISVRPAQGPAVTLTKQGGAWFVSSPLRARADPARVAGLLGLLRAQSTLRLPAENLAQFGLDAPHAEVVLDTQRFQFGGTDPLNQQVYVLTQQSIYLVSPVYLFDVAKQPADYAAKALFGDKEQALAFVSASLSLRRIDGKWVRQPPAPQLSQDQANALADSWRHALADTVSNETPGAPLQTIDIDLGKGALVRFSVLQRAPELLLRRDDEGLTYHFPPETAQQLLGPLAGASPK